MCTAASAAGSVRSEIEAADCLGSRLRLAGGAIAPHGNGFSRSNLIVCVRANNSNRAAAFGYLDGYQSARGADSWRSPERGQASVLELGQEICEIQGANVHLDLLAGLRIGPLIAIAVPVKLDPVLIGVTQIKCLAYPMI